MSTSELWEGVTEEIPSKEKVFFDHSNYKKINFMVVTLNLTLRTFILEKKHNSNSMYM